MALDSEAHNAAVANHYMMVTPCIYRVTDMELNRSVNSNKIWKSFRRGARTFIYQRFIPGKSCLILL